MKKLHYVISPMALVALVAVLFINSKQNEKISELESKINNESGIPNTYEIAALKKPTKITFAGIKIPLNEPDLYERFDRELHVNTYRHSSTIILIKRAKKYFPIIEPILAKHGIPDDFKYLAVAESGLDNVTSPAGAKGFWQFMKPTAKSFGMEVNDYVDERYHLEKATEAACKYLKKARKQLGNADWMTVAASYNRGVGGIKKQQNRQGSTHYLDLILNPETSRYIFRIAAIKQILKNPRNYGFQMQHSPSYQLVPTTTVVIDSAVTDFSAFAENLGINYKILKIHNPWLRETYLKNKSKKKYRIKIPKSGYYKSRH
ncbi:MAG: lytic transglycosylase domain-containing protein [Flavobacteriales bacterium]|jgi:hypothetical protein|nr:lytic transglycosylase domain-containing protein [Flavobacteriales bacterium]